MSETPKKKPKRRRYVKRECPCGHCNRCTLCGEWVPKGWRCLHSKLREDA